MKPMNIVVCTKPVPNPKYWDRIGLDSKTKTLIRAGVPAVMNPLDVNALEAALRIKEARGGKVTVVSMGPPEAKKALANALVRGADEGILITDRVLAGSDTLATAYALAAGLRKAGSWDLILLGNLSLDGASGNVPPQLAEFLDLPHVTRVTKIDFVGDAVQVRSRIELGYMVIEVKLPAVLSVEKDINEPRLPSAFGVVDAEKKPITVWSAKDLGLDEKRVGLSGSPTKITDIFAVEMTRRAELLKGEPREIARQLVSKLRADGVFKPS